MQTMVIHLWVKKFRQIQAAGRRIEAQSCDQSPEAFRVQRRVDAGDFRAMFFVGIVRVETQSGNFALHRRAIGGQRTRRFPRRQDLQRLADEVGVTCLFWTGDESFFAISAARDGQQVAKSRFDFLEQLSFAGAPVVIVLDPARILHHNVVKRHCFGDRVPVQKPCHSKRNVKGISLDRDSHQMLEVEDKQSAIIEPGALLGALFGFGFVVNQALQQVQFVEIHLAASAGRTTKLTRATLGDVVVAAVLCRQRYLQPINCRDRNLLSRFAVAEYEKCQLICSFEFFHFLHSSFNCVYPVSLENVGDESAATYANTRLVTRFQRMKLRKYHTTRLVGFVYSPANSASIANRDGGCGFGENRLAAAITGH